MLSKTQIKFSGFKSQQGFTLVELIVASAITLIILSAVFIYYNPVEKNKRVRDEKRLSDISKIDEAVSGFMLDHKRFPDTVNTLRKSTVLPTGATKLNSSVKGWIFENISGYIPMLPTDPLNNETYYYSYIYTANGYELNAKLENLTDQMENDGGNDPAMYEIGNNLTLISP